ncbi:MAG: DegV family protein [Candidatus Limiplasma sp.]|nr:DegV family protein [Candidatus Limiplasma sp.]
MKKHNERSFLVRFGRLMQDSFIHHFGSWGAFRVDKNGNFIDDMEAEQSLPNQEEKTMKWNIVTDSSSDLLPEKNNGGLVQISSVPFIISVGDTEYIDDEGLDTLALLDAMEQCAEASHTSCPTPNSWLEEFEKAEQTIAITISSRLSGSMNSAMLAREMALEKNPNRKIAVIDSCSAGPELILCVEKAVELIGQGLDFDAVVSGVVASLKESHVAFALSSFDNLVKNGRMSKMAGFVARKLGMWGIGVGGDDGTIKMKGKTRGDKRAIEYVLTVMAEYGFRGGKVIISHCHNLNLAGKLRNRILELWTNTEVKVFHTRGLCCYYAERGGLIVGY